MNNVNINQSLKSLESLYIKGEIASAVDAQKKMEGALNPGHLYYNLGSLYLKKGDVAAARYYLELSKKNNFNTSMVDHNLGVAKRTLEVKEIGLEEGFTNNAINFVLQTSPVNFLTLTLILSFLTLFIWRIRLFKNKIVIIICFLISFIPFLFQQFYLSKIKFAISLDVTEIHEGPSAIFSKIGSVRPGEKVLVGEENNNWLYISYPKNLNGWVDKSKVGIL
ncbi:MAG: SH3 domain-containing protein [Bacteriovoracales bacterium]